MLECHKIYRNCIWQVPPEWHGLNFDSALLANLYWNYATHIVRVCVSSKSAINPNLHVYKKNNLQVHFSSKAMARLYELICHHSLKCFDPLLEELFSYLRTRFSSHIFEYIAYENSDDESVRSIDSSISAFYSNDSTYLSSVLL